MTDQAQDNYWKQELIDALVRQDPAAPKTFNTSNALIDAWVNQKQEAPSRISAYAPHTLAEKVSGAVGSGLESLGVDGRLAMDYGHRSAGLTGALTAEVPFLAHDIGLGVGREAADGNYAGAAGVAAIGAATAGIGYGIPRYLMGIPNVGGINLRDVAMAKTQQTGILDGIMPPLKGLLSHHPGVNMAGAGANANDAVSRMNSIGTAGNEITPMTGQQIKYFNAILKQRSP